MDARKREQERERGRRIREKSSTVSKSHPLPTAESIPRVEDRVARAAAEPPPRNVYIMLTNKWSR